MLGNLLEGEPGAVGSALFLAGLLLAPRVSNGLGDFSVAFGALPSPPETPLGWGQLIVAGLLVGFGTRMANGCTSGHGVCGLARRSPRSLAAVVVFMSAGAASVFVLRHLFSGG